MKQNNHKYVWMMMIKKSVSLTIYSPLDSSVYFTSSYMMEGGRGLNAKYEKFSG